MKKRILILTLSLLFLVSTTGLPVTINLCKMAESGETGKCMMHHKLISSLCCANEVSVNHPAVSSVVPDCCRTEFVYNKVKDEFVANKTDVNFFSSIQNLVQIITIVPSGVDFTFEETFYCDSSPPFLINPQLNITNSIFLI